MSDCPVPDLASSANVLDWIPAMEDIPDKFKRSSAQGDDKMNWVVITHSWFFNGLPDTVKFYGKPGIDAEAAFKALSVLLSSFAPKHQHKEAAVAYLMDCWFTKIKGWQKEKG